MDKKNAIDDFKFCLNIVKNWLDNNMQHINLKKSKNDYFACQIILKCLLNQQLFIQTTIYSFFSVNVQVLKTLIKLNV